jgi:hypothetical protein
MPAPIRVAVLDDYQGISEPKFKSLDPAKYEVTFFRDTLLPYNHPDTPQEVKDKLATRLEPFTVICSLLPTSYLPIHTTHTVISK